MDNKIIPQRHEDIMSKTDYNYNNMNGCLQRNRTKCPCCKSSLSLISHKCICYANEDVVICIDCNKKWLRTGKN